MRILFVLFLILITLPTSYSSAQVGGSVSDIIGDNIAIVLDPQYPNPGERVVATIDDYAINNTGATITWYFDGLSAPAVENNRTINFTAPAVGTPMKIVARLKFRNDKILEATRTITPLYLDLIIEPLTYTPLFYQGRSLPTKGSLINLNALLQDKNGPVSVNDYNYTWTLNNKSVYGGGKIGGNWAQIEVPHGQSSVVGIMIQNRAGITVARKVVAIPIAKLDVQFYELNTLLGLNKRAITSDFTIVGNSTSIRAVPYNLDNRAVNNNLFTQWSINGLPIVSDNNDPFELNLQRGVAGTAQVGFKIRNLTELLQSDEEFFKIKL